MVMKDKLVKNHHKGSYYRARQILIGGAVAFGVAALVAVPTYISINQNEQFRVKAEESEIIEEEEKEDSEEVENKLVSFTEDK